MNILDKGSIALCAIVLTLLGLAACDEPKPQERFEHAVANYGGTPVDATNVEFIDGRWYTFEWRGQCFLAKNNFHAHATAMMSKIDCGSSE